MLWHRRPKNETGSHNSKMAHAKPEAMTGAAAIFNYPLQVLLVNATSLDSSPAKMES